MIKMHLCRQLASELELRLGDARLIVLLIAAWLCCGVWRKTSGTYLTMMLDIYIDFLFPGLVAGVVYPSCAGW